MFKDFLCANIIKHQICFEKKNNNYIFKVLKVPYTARISSLPYKSDAKIYIIIHIQSFLNREDDLYTPLSENKWDLMTKLPSLEMIYSYNDTTDEELQDCR